MSRLVVVLASACVLATACSGSDGPSRASAGGGATLPPGIGFTSDQLREALPAELVGYRRTGEPEAGEYGTLKGIQNFNQLQRQVTYDKPKCREGTGAAATGDAALRAMPAAIAVFNKGTTHSASTTLMAVPNDIADQQLRVRMPAGCKEFRTRIGDQWSEHRVVESADFNLGTGARILGVATTTGDTAVKTWYVLMRGRGYLATISVYGPTASRAEVEQLARQTYDHAERVL